MQSKLLLSALLFPAASFADVAINSDGIVCIYASLDLSFAHADKLPKPPRSDELHSYRDSQSNIPEYTAYTNYIKTASLEAEERRFISGHKSTDVPAFVTSLPSSLQDYASSYLVGEASIIRDQPTETYPSEHFASGRSKLLHSRPIGTGATPLPASVASGANSNSASSASRNSTTTAASALPLATSNTSTSHGSLSVIATPSSTPNVALQPTGAFRAAGALAVGVVGMLVLM